MKDILFLCAASATRAQIGAGLLRALAGDHYRITSAGVTATPLSPLAAAVMDECGIDIRTHPATTIDHVRQQHFDYIVTLYDAAVEECPTLPGPAIRIRWSFADPEASEAGTQLESFRAVRDGLESRLRAWFV